MASGFCVSMLMLSLGFGPLVTGNAYRYEGENFRHYPPQAETLRRSYGPVPSTYEGALRPRGSVASSKLPGSLPAEASKPWGSVPSQSGHSRQVNGYSQPGSVSSYKSAPVLTSQQPQTNLYQKQAAREPSSGQGERRYGASVVSSGAIEIRAPEKPPQQSGSQGNLLTKPGMWEGSSASSEKSPAFALRLPPQHPAFSAPAVLQTKAGMWDSINAPSAKSPAFASRLPPQHPAFSAPAVLQTKAGMWDSINAPSAKSPESAARQRQVFSAPVVQQNQDYAWRNAFAHRAKSPDSTASRHQHRFSVPAALETVPHQLNKIYISSANPPASTAQRHKKPTLLAPTVLQIQQGAAFPQAVNPRSSRPAAPGSYAGRPETQQQAGSQGRKLPMSGSPASFVLQNKEVHANPQMIVGPRSSSPLHMAPLHQHGNRQPQRPYHRI